ncbi:MAG: DUF4058 family protein [Gemmataceae bacterium]|nr:DUF4058 family protein [Gemmataceae bacterium]
MPLLDHFHAPLFPQRSWESFHSRWANSIADYLQGILPDRYFAEVQIHLGSLVEADVAEFEKTVEAANGPPIATAVQAWAPPAAPLVLPAIFPDDLEVHVKDSFDDARLVAAVELVSPRNKDRADSRRAFAVKLAAYLQRGVGLAVLDVVSNRHVNLHNELLRTMNWQNLGLMAEDALSAVAYHPTRRGEDNVIDVWPHVLALGQPLPVIPLALRSGPILPLELETTYEAACQRSKL